MALISYEKNIPYKSGRITVAVRYQQGRKYVPFSSHPNPLPPLPYFSDTWYATPKAIRISSPQVYPPSSYSGPIGDAVRDHGVGENGYPYGFYGRLAYSKAFRKFWGDVLNDHDKGGTASLGVSVAEGREAIEAIVERATRLRNAYQFLRRGRFASFLKEIGGRPKSKHKNTVWTRPKDASSLWLEYWLGWAPLVGDIQACAQVLTSSDLFPPKQISVRSTVKWTETMPSWGPSNGLLKCEGRCSVSVGMGAHVVVVNPNAYLAARLGLVNWLEIGWAVVPFSFIVDWFTNIGQILASLTTRNIGVSLSQAWVSSNCKGNGIESWWRDKGTGFDNLYEYPDIHVALSRRVITGDFIPRPKLYLSLPQSFKPSRAATAISLLVSMLTKG